jgi:plasmid stabilization system protein ParE
MPRGDKSKYTAKQKRKAQHIADSYLERGLKRDEAEQRAWATVNKQDGGGAKPRSKVRRRPTSSANARARSTARKSRIRTASKE